MPTRRPLYQPVLALLVTLALSLTPTGRAQSGYTSRSIFTSTQQNFCMASDPSGNVYATTGYGNSYVDQFVAVNGFMPASPQVNLLGPSGATPFCFARDASGDIVYIDGFHSIKEMFAVNGVVPNNPTVATLYTTPNSSYDVKFGVAIDLSGNVFFVQEYGGGQVTTAQILELQAVNGSIPSNPNIITILSDNASFFGRLTFDKHGNLYYPYEDYKIYELAAVNGTIPANATPQLFLSSPTGQEYFDGNIAFDANGNVFFADIISTSTATTGQVQEALAVNGVIPANPTITTLYSADNSVFSPQQIALGVYGDIYVSNSTYNPNIFSILDISPAKSFPPINVGSSSQPISIAVTLTQASTVSSITVPTSVGNKQEYTVGTVTGCATDGVTSNPAGTACTIPVTFSPAYPGQRNIPLQVTTSAGKINVGLNAFGQGPLATLTPGIMSTVAGNGTQGFGGDGGPATAAQTRYVYAVVSDSLGNLYLSDYSRIRKIDALTGIITTIIGANDGSNGYTPDGALASSALLGSAFGLVVGSDGSIYYTDDDYDLVRKIDGATGILSTVAGVYQQPGYNGDGGPAKTAELHGVAGIAMDAAGDLYVADRGNQRIRKITLSTGIISTVAGNGTTGSIGDGGPATAAELTDPGGIVVDPAGNLFISSGNTKTIRKVTASTGNISIYVGNGTGADTGDGGPAASAGIYGSDYLAMDAAGDLYFIDGVPAQIRYAKSTHHPAISTASLAGLASAQPMASLPIS